jgi:hypothetical protein
LHRNIQKLIGNVQGFQTGYWMLDSGYSKEEIRVSDKKFLGLCCATRGGQEEI